MDFRKLRYALAVAKERSFTRAAEKVNISQSAISEQVRLLEEEIGFPIFNRSSRGIHLTDRGRSFLHEAERVYNEMLSLSDTARLLHGGGETFVIGIGSGVAQFVVPDALVGFSKEFPNVRLEVRTSPTRQIYDLLHDEHIDAGISVEGDPEKLPAGIVQRRISETEMVLVLPAGHALGGGTRAVTLEEIAKAPLIMNELSVGYGQIVQSMFEGIGARPNIVGVTDNIDTMRVMVECGLGIAVLPKTYFDPVPAQARIQIRRLLPTRKISFCVIRRQRVMPKNRERHYEFLCQALGVEI